MTAPINKIEIVRIKVYTLDSPAYRYQRPVGITFRWNNIEYPHLSITGLEASPPLYWLPYFMR